MFALPADARVGAGRATGQGSAGGGADASSANGVAHFRFRELAIEDLASQAANLRLGLHAHINHVIRCALDPLWGPLLLNCGRCQPSLSAYASFSSFRLTLPLLRTCGLFVFPHVQCPFRSS